MQQKNKAIRLLVLHESPDEAEQIINALRNIGTATRATQIFTEEELVNNLKSQSWDLFLARPEADGIGVAQYIQHIKRLEKDIPTIVIADDEDPDIALECMEAGAKDVVPHKCKELMVLVILRELGNLQERRLRRQSDSYLQETERRCNLLLESSKDAIAYVTDGMHVHANESYLSAFGYDDVEDLEGMPMLDMIAPKDHDAFKEFFKQYNGKASEQELNCLGLRGDGSEIKMNMELSEASYHGEPCVQIVIRPYLKEVVVSDQVPVASGKDLLTGVSDRQVFEKAMNGFVEQALNEERTSHMLYIALDRYQQIKVNFGIADAELVLIDIATTLNDIVVGANGSDVDKQYSGVLARYSESEFTVLIDSDDLDRVKDIANQMRSTIEQQMFEVQGKTIQLTTSIGVAAINESCPGAQEVVNRAHKACIIARDEGSSGASPGNCIVVYEPPAPAVSDDQIIQDQLVNAIDKGLLKILYQPVVSLRGDHREFYEVLLRMMDEDGNEVLPGEFLPSASRGRLSEKIDRWVVVQTLKSLSAHIAQGHETRVIINLTAESLRDKNLLSWLSVALRAARVPTDCLIFQITEPDATTYLKQAVQFTKGLKQLHCRSSISRFGGSINPINTLKHLDVDYLKMDASFTQEIDNEESREKLKELVTAVHSMDKTTIAPFVESAGVLSTLWQIGIGYIQGYYLSPPMEKMDYEFSADD